MQKPNGYDEAAVMGNTKEAINPGGHHLIIKQVNEQMSKEDPATGKTIHITKNVAIVPSTYVMTYAKDYRLLLNEIQLYGDYQRERE